MEIIETDRLILRKPNLSDAKSLLPLLSDKDVKNFNRGLHRSTLQDIISYIEIVNTYDYPMDICLVIELKKSKHIVGIIEGFVLENIFPISSACMKSERGNGYIPEATKAFIRYLQSNYHLDSVNFSIKKENESSKRVMEKLGITADLDEGDYISFSMSLKEELPF